MLCEIKLKSNGAVLTGSRTWWMAQRETRGFHHFRIVDVNGNMEYAAVVGKTMAIPLDNIEHLIILEE